MKQTQYFTYTRKRPDRKIVKLEWIENVITNPIKLFIKVMDGFENGGILKKLINI